MSKSVNVSRIVGLLVLLMAAVVVLSGPVAEVLDPGSEPVAEAKKKHKKKKKKKKKPFPFNVVQCPTNGENSLVCNGTLANDYLIGGPADRPFGAFDRISGGEGTDVYNGGDGSDDLVDESTTSSDVYLFPATDFGEGDVFDDGGASDLVGLGSYSIEDFGVLGFEDDLFLDGPGEKDVEILDFSGGGKIEFFLFREGYFTADQVAGGFTQATIEEQAALEEQLKESPASSVLSAPNEATST